MLKLMAVGLLLVAFVARAESESVPSFSYDQIKPQGAETKTDAAMRQLADYGNKLLEWHAKDAKAKLEKRKVKERASLTQYSFGLKGFYEKFGRDYDLYYSGNVKKVQKLVEEVALFLKNFHTDLGGSAYPPFDSVVIEPVTNFDIRGSRITQRGMELTIYTPGGDTVYTANQLRDWWNRCDHLGVLCSSKGAKQKWAFLNPVGNIQVQLRQNIRRMMETVFSEFQWFREESPKWDVDKAKEELHALVKKLTNGKYRTADGKTLTDRIDEKTAKAETVQQVVELLEKWKREMSQDSIQEEVSKQYGASWVLGKQHFVRRATNVWAVFYLEWTDDIIVSVGHDTIVYDPADSEHDDKEKDSAGAVEQPDYIRAILALKLNESETIDVGNVDLSLSRLLGVQSVALDRTLR